MLFVGNSCNAFIFVFRRSLNSSAKVEGVEICFLRENFRKFLKSLYTRCCTILTALYEQCILDSLEVDFVELRVSQMLGQSTCHAEYHRALPFL
jgi:hypothetical protein